MVMKDRLEQERELMRRLLEKEGLGAPTAEVVAKNQPPHSSEASETALVSYPLSCQQEQLWFLDQFQPGSDFYNVPFVLRLKGELDASMLERSLREVVRRHEILRTCFVADENGEPMQRVAGEGLDVRLPLVDLRDLDLSEKEERAQKIISEHGRIAFDLGQAPLFRGVLLRMGEREHVFGLTLHHILCDEWSLGVFMEELAALYKQVESGEESLLPQLAMQYGEYALEQRKEMRAGKFQRQMEYWKAQLAGMPQVIELQTDHARLVRQSFRGGILHQSLEGDLLEGLNALGRAEGASLFMTLLAVFQVLLMRYIGQEDFGVGISTANRSRSNTHQLIGFFLNTLVMRARFGGEPTFREVLRQVRQTALDAYEHQDLPYQKLVEELTPDRDISRNPLVQVMFTVRKPVDSKVGRFEVGEFEASLQTSKFDLTMIVDESDQGKIAINYSTDLFEPETIARMLGHYAQLLKAVVADPAQRVWDLPLLTDAETAQLVQWNHTSRDYERDRNAVELFEECAARRPNTVAVEYQGQELTYEELNRRSNRLAHYLRTSGVGPDVRVGICMERSVEMVVGLLGILKAGGAYVPLDPSYPQERLRYMLEDSRPAVLLTQGHLKGLFSPLSSGAPLLDMTDANPAWNNQPDTNPDGTSLAADDLAYVIYTSGSTGKPKGAMNTHGAIRNRLLWMQERYGLQADDRVLQKTSFSFDVSVWEFFWPLISGARLVMARPEGHRDSKYLVEVIRKEKITTIHFVPSMLKVFLSEEEVEECKSLRRVICSGEALSGELRRQFFHRLECGLHNLYGPTEAAVDVTAWECRREEEGENVPIGRPIANTAIHVLDGQLQEVPVGVAGEIYIGGVGVARGYLNRAESTAERFVADPFAADAGGRMYRTGDLGRWLANGAIEYLGRNDDQVKVRGYRIELGEIEARLAEHVGIRDAVVLARKQGNESDEKQLVAYCVGAEGKETGVEELRNHLQKTLPAYMVPTAYVFLKEMPLNPNGKVDRKALPAPRGDAFAVHAYEAPRGGTETEVAGVWAKLLHVERVGRQDNFFDLGGHSLLATSMVAKFRSAFGIDVPVRAIFESPTIADLAEVIELDLKSQGKKLSEAAERATSKQVASGARPSVFPLSHQQEQLWFLDRFQPDSDFYNVPSAWTLKGDLDVPRLERSLGEIVRRHEILRTCFVMGDYQEPVQKVVEEVDIRLRLVDLREVEAGEREKRLQKIIEEEAGKGFDLRQLPLFRGVLVRMEEKEHVFGLTLHHIVCDDWSLGVLMEEWVALYEAYGRGEESPLADLGMQYGDYAAQQRDGLRGGKLQQQMDYWKAQLNGMPQVLELPTDLGRPARQSFRGRIEQQSLRGDLWEGLNAVGRGERASLFMTLLAACQVLLMRYSGQEDFGVGTPVSNRKWTETEGIIGFFLNTLVLRANLRGEPTFREALQRVRQAALGGYEHQDLSFEKLVEELAPERDVSRTPIFQVLFTSLGEAGKLEFGGLEWIGFAMDLKMAKFDLTISVQEEVRGATVTVNYTTDLFEPETIQRMLGHYEQLLKAVVENPGQRVWSLPMLTAPEKAQLEGWNQTARDYPRDKTIAGLFEECAANTPDAVAVEYEGRELQYGDLNRQVNRLAHYLRALGVKPDTLVAICVERSLEMIVGLFAVMKAGGAYTPLDPASPEERLRLMVEDSRPAVLLTQSHLRGLFTGIRDDLKVVDLGSAEDWNNQPDSNPEHATIGLTAEDLVYVIYTSGSTGTPKGVAMPACAAVNLLVWQIHESASFGHQRTLQFAPLGFDVSYQEIFSTLCAGGTLVLIDEEQRRNSTHLTRYVLEKGIQRLFLPYVGLKMLAEGVAQRANSRDDGKPFDCVLQEINVAGEQLRIDDKIRELFQHLKHCRLNNHYGPTETHAATAFHLGTQGDLWPVLPSIGQPIANARIYILDKHREFVPVGVAGELFIGGVGVARGYLNRSDLTDQRFLKDTFTNEDGARMYQTGDLGRWRPDGTIEFIGRNDSQVKIRGYRVELGEIEAMLQQQNGVRDSAVVAKASANGSKRLVAYVVGDRDHEELRRELKSTLPAYMVPSVIVGLRELPQSDNGKVDRQALEKLEDAGLSAEHYEAPGTATEEQLAEIWTELLEVSRVGRQDNFFDLGGHSLLATLLATRLESAFGIHVPVRAIFEAPTIAELAEVIETGLKSQEGKLPRSGKSEPPKQVASGPRPSLFPLSFQQEQLWFLDRLNPDNAFYNVPMTWRLNGDLDVPRLERSLRELVRRHEILRTCFVTGEQEEPRQKVVESIEMRLPVLDLRGVAADEREERARKVLAEEAGKTFDLSQAPLLRAALVRVEEREHVVGLTLHHIICDDWSLGVLMGELGKLYEAFGRGEELPLADLGMQYGDYALEQREALRGGRFERQMGYWRGQLEGMPHVLELPTDLPRPPRQSFRGGTEYRVLQSGLWERLNVLGRQEKANSLMMMLAACQVLLMRYSGQEDFGIGTVVANRKQKETRGLIGFFLSTLVIRANLRGGLSFREVLRQVREAVLSGYEYQDLSFEKLVEELAPDRDLSRSPLFQVAFILRRAFEGESEFGGLELLPFELDPGTSKFDLIVSVEEGKQSAIIALNYTTDLFEAETIRRMLERYERLLEGIVADADQSIWSLPMMRESDEKALSAWNFAGPVAHPARNIVEIFDAQAEKCPQELAAVFGETRLSCGDLGHRANQLAHYLIHLGMAPESQVGIFMHESPERMVAILGVLKAGCAYVLLDVMDPKDRLRSIIDRSSIGDRSGIGVLLAMENLRRRLPQAHPHVVCLDSEQEAIGRQAATNPSVQINPQGLACVIYTAASGKHIKGWMVEHNGLLCLASTPEIADATHQNGHAPENRVPEIYLRLTSGSFLAGTSAFLTLVAGERSSFRSRGNAEIYLLDPYLQRVAMDIPGELWISGSAAGRGYLGRPSLTAENFSPSPFTSEMGARMRRSGVKARYRQDGTIELLGRLDDQVEIGGFQVELGEIEAALANLEIVREAVAVVRPNGELVAYVVLDGGKRMGQNDLGAYLYDRLPSYMLPAAFITLQELPRKAGGEVDRATLAVLGQEQLNNEFVLPRTELERTIAAAWQTVLAVERVGVHDNFFDLGGHSLLMIQLQQKLRAELSVEIELLHLFQFPTIDSLVRFLHAGYNFDEKSRETQDRAGKQKSAVQKFKRIHTP